MRGYAAKQPRTFQVGTQNNPLNRHAPKHEIRGFFFVPRPRGLKPAAHDGFFSLRLYLERGHDPYFVAVQLAMGVGSLPSAYWPVIWPVWASAVPV